MSSKDDEQAHRTGVFFYGWVIALCCTLITIINGGIFFTFSVFFKPVMLEFGWTRGEFAFSYTAMLVAYAPAAFVAGKVADKHGPRPILLLAALLIGLGFFGCSQAPNLVFMTLSYATIGLGLGATLALPTATIQRWFVKWRGLMVGIVIAGTGVGGFIFSPLANYLISSGGWQMAYITIGLIDGVVVAVAASFLISEPAAYYSASHGNGTQDIVARYRTGVVAIKPLTSTQIFRLGTFWAIAAIYVLTNIPDFFIKSHLVLHVTDQGISSTIAAQSLGVVAGAMVVGRITMSWVAGKIGWMNSLAISCFVASASVVSLLFVRQPSTLYLFTIAYGFSWGSTLALLGGAVGFFFGLTALSELLGFLFGLTVLVSAIAPFLGGLSFDLTGSYLIAIVVAAAFFALAGILSIFLRSSR